MQNAASSNISESNESGSFPLSMTTLAGITAKVSDPKIAAIRPKVGRIVMYRSTIANIPAMTWGRDTDQPLTPNRPPTMLCIQNETGGLSTVTIPWVSKDAKKKLFAF